MLQDRIAVINGLRGVAILGVVYTHLLRGWTPPGHREFELFGVTLYPYSPLSNSWLGVSLFFVLSGFVLFAPYAAGRRSMQSGADAAAFLRRRALRLLPLYYIASMICFLFVLPPGLKHFSDFVALVTVTFPFTRTGFMPAYNWVLWSLGVEIWISALFPLLVFAWRRFGMGWVCLGSFVLSLAVRTIGTEPGFYDSNPILNYVKDGPLGRLDDFVLGMLAASLYRRAGGQGQTKRWAVPGIVTGMLLFFVTASLWDSAQLGRIDRHVIGLLYNLFQASSLLVILGLLFTRSRVLTLLFANRPLQLLGMMCYSLYVWHGLAVPRIVGPTISTEGLLAYAVIVLFLSALTYRFVEFGHVRDGKALFTPAKT